MVESPPVQRFVTPREYICIAYLPGMPLEEKVSPAHLFFTINNKTLWMETKEPGFPRPRFDYDDINVGVVQFERVRGFDHPVEAAMCWEGRVVGNGEEEGAVRRILTEALPARVPLLPRVSLVLGKFAPEHNTCMKPWRRGHGCSPWKRIGRSLRIRCCTHLYYLINALLKSLLSSMVAMEACVMRVA